METEDIIEEESSQLVSFIVGTEKYGIDILYVREIIRVIDITPVPMARPEILGVINLRGSVIPAVDFRLLFSLESIEATKDTRIIVIDYAEVVIGILVDSVSEVVTIPTSRFESAPRTSNADIPDFINSVIVLDDAESLLLVVDVDAFFKQHDVPLEAIE